MYRFKGLEKVIRREDLTARLEVPVYNGMSQDDTRRTVTNLIRFTEAKIHGRL